MRNLLSWSILKEFSRADTLFFGLQDVVRAFPGEDNSRLKRTLASMLENGMLCKIARDTYHIIPLDADPGSYVPDGRIVAKYLVQDENYYIGYTTALGVLGLSVIDPARVFVVARRQVNPGVRVIRGTSYHFIRHVSERIFGFRSIWVNQLERVHVSDLEKSIVDMASNPFYQGSILDLGKVLLKARDRINNKTLFYYFARTGNRSAIKRFLYLAELLKLDWGPEHDIMMKEIGTGTTILEPHGTKHGRTIVKYGLRINVDPERIRKEAYRK